MTNNKEVTWEGGKIRVYLCARISRDAHAWNEHVCKHLSDPLSVFMPQKHNPWNVPHEEFPRDVFETDLTAMKEADMCLMLPPYGRDCAWEAGWLSNSDKPVIIFVDDQLEWLRDWMIKGGADFIFTTNRETLKRLRRDNILGSRAFYIEKISQLCGELIKIYRRMHEC